MNPQIKCPSEYFEPMPIHEVLRDLRISRGISQDALGAALGKSQATLSRWEEGKVSLVNLTEWATQLGFEPSLAPTDRAESQLSILQVAGELAPAELEDLAALVSSFRDAPTWARTAALNILANTSKELGAKSA